MGSRLRPASPLGFSPPKNACSRGSPGPADSVQSPEKPLAKEVAAARTKLARWAQLASSDRPDLSENRLEDLAFSANAEAQQRNYGTASNLDQTIFQTVKDPNASRGIGDKMD